MNIKKRINLFEKKHKIINIIGFEKSAINPNSYFMTENKVFIANSRMKILNSIDLPKSKDIICFYDIYYDGNELKLIVATRSAYDVALVLDENNMCILNEKPTK